MNNLCFASHDPSYSQNAWAIAEKALSSDNLSQKEKGDMLNCRGMAYSALGRHKQGLEDLNEAVRLAPEVPNNYWNRGTIWHRLGRRDRAEDDYAKSRELRQKKAVELKGKPGLGSPD
jgi:Flp pilus assembly protein TadD